MAGGGGGGGVCARRVILLPLQPLHLPGRQMNRKQSLEVQPQIIFNVLLICPGDVPEGRCGGPGRFWGS